MPILPEDTRRPPPENEIIFHPQGEMHEDFSCCECSEEMRPKQPRWRIKDTEYRICQKYVNRHRIFMGELRTTQDTP